MFRNIIISIILSCSTLTSAFCQEESVVRKISLAEVSKLALENNFDIQLTKYDIQISRYDIEDARSIYDVIFSASASYAADDSTKNSTLLSDRVTSRAFSAALSKKFSTGTEISVMHGSDRAWGSSPSSIFYNPAYDSAASVTVSQDLGKNFFGLQDRGDVKVTMKDVENATFLSFDKIEQSLSDALKAYWGLVLAQELYDIEREFLAQAKRLYDIDRERIEHGLIEKPQLLGSEANYQERLGDLLLAENNLKAKENVLRLQLNIDQTDRMRLQPNDEFQFVKVETVLKDALKNAFEFRRDYLRAMNEIERRDILLSIKKNGLWPEINLEATFSRNGLDDSYGGATRKIGDENNKEILTLLSVSMPIENRQARAASRQAELQKAKALLDAKYLERRIAIEVIDQVRQCEALYERLAAIMRAADLQTQKASEQEKIFRRGRSDSDTVIRYQEDALSARKRAANAFFDYYAALIDLRKKEGTLLEEHWDEGI